MGRLFRACADFLDTDGWSYDVRKHVEGDRIRFGFTGENAILDCWIVCYEETERLCMLAIYPLAVPDNKRAAVAEYLTRANFGILVGNFEFDMRDGEVRFKTATDVEDTPLSHKFVKNMLVANLGTADRYFPGLMKVLYANMAPADAVAVVRDSH
ncbi:MAG TPA: YbjN domain-containing protein [Myxococcota bacterium]|nr:YbjN domain-containing protein [Myxococcota bacterium]